MAPKANPVCLDCKKTESLLWRSVDNGQICQICFEEREAALKEKAVAEEAAKELEKKDKNPKEEAKEVKDTGAAAADDKCTRLRKSTRATRFKTKATSNPHPTASNNNGEKPTAANNTKTAIKGRSRRSIFKRMPLKTPHAQATTHTVESVFHKGTYLQVGDIVSLVDKEDNVYYAQVRGLLIDNYSEKSAFLTWLIPTQESPDPKYGFDPATYLIGLDEELSRKLSFLEFVMHAPSNYYLDRTTPFPLPECMECDTKPGGYIWTTLPEYHRPNNTIEV